MKETSRSGLAHVRVAVRSSPFGDRSEVAGRTSSGIGFVDELLEGGLRPGDNVLLRFEEGTPIRALLDAFVQAPAPHVVIVDLTGAWSASDETTTILDWRPLLDPGTASPAGARRIPPETDVDDLARQLAQLGSEVGAGAFWLFDSFTAIAHAIGPEDALALFLIACPRLFRQESIALLPLDPAAHERGFLDRMRSTVQVVLDLRRVPAGIEIEVVKADGRPASTVGRRTVFRVVDSGFEVGQIESGQENIGRLLRAERNRRGMSQADLGRLVGVSASAISQFERGVSGVSGHVLTRIWQALDVPFGPPDDRRRGYRIVRRGEMAATELYEGVSATVLFDNDRVGTGWHVTVAPETSRRRAMFQAIADEVILVRRGVFDVEIAGELQTLHEGDSLITTSERITSWRNPAPRPAELLWLTLHRSRTSG